MSHVIGSSSILYQILFSPEFWKQVPSNEPYRVILGDVRDKLYHTRERARQLLANGISDIPEELSFTNVEEVCSLKNFFCVQFASSANYYYFFFL